MSLQDSLLLARNYHNKSLNRIHLIPSENVMSYNARLPFLTELAHRYCFTAGDEENWAWPGNLDMAKIQNQAVIGIQRLFDAKYVNIKPISGINCMAIALSALTQSGTTVFCLSESDGGHGSTKFIAKKLGLNILDIPIDTNNYCIDLERFWSLSSKISGNKLVYLDQFMCLFPHDLVSLRSIVGEGAFIHYDGSHVMGLIAGGKFQNPLKEGADCLGGSTHKTFPGPNKGVILSNSQLIGEKIDLHASNWVSQYHPASVAALAITTEELLTNNWIAEYAERTINNAQYLAQKLANYGFCVCAENRGFTRSHQIWIDIEPLIKASDASNILLEAGIVVNAIPIPYINAELGLRLGVQEISRLGMGVMQMDQISDIFNRLLVKREDPSRISFEVSELAQKYKLIRSNTFQDLFNSMG